MPQQNIVIRANNHRVHPCPTKQKMDLVNTIIEKNQDKSIVVVSSSANDMLKENIEASNVSILSDKEFITNKDLSCELLISYDLPDSAEIYIARASKATVMAVVLLDPSEYAKLYPIEILLGRVLKHEVIEGYEPKIEKKDKPQYDTKKMSKEKIKEVAKKRYSEKTSDKPKKELSTPKKEFKKSSDKSSAKKENSYKKPRKIGRIIKVKAHKKPKQ